MVEEGAPKLPSVGDVVGGKYRVDRVIGRGGMGTVLAVRHLGLDEARALKLMLPRGLELPQSRERFFREARAAAKLRSENAVAVHDVGVLPDGFPYIEMELLEGADLAQMLKRNPSVPVASAVEWIAQACEAVGEAHAHGIVHRDLKPGNLFLSRMATGRELIKVLDFGIAKTASADTDPTLTGTNASFGSPMYMSPEQMRGARYADPRSDIWGLGVVLFELITGKRPFAAESVTALALIVTGDPAPHPRSLRADIPPDVDAIVMRCLEKQPEKRFASAAELAVALRAAIGATAPPPRGSLASLPLLPRSPSVAGAPIPSIPIPVAPGSQPSQPSQQVGPSQSSQPSMPMPMPAQAQVPEPPQPPRPPLPSDPTNVVSMPHVPPYRAPASSSPTYGPPMRTPAPTTPLPPNVAASSFAMPASAPMASPMPSSPMTSTRPSVATLPTMTGVTATPRPAFIAIAAALAGTLVLVVALVAWRARGPESTPSPAAAPTIDAPVAPIEPTPPAAEPPEPTVAAPSPAPTPAPTMEAAPPSASSVASTPSAPSVASSDRPLPASTARPGKLPARPKTGFGGID